MKRARGIKLLLLTVAGMLTFSMTAWGWFCKRLETQGGSLTAPQPILQIMVMRDEEEPFAMRKQTQDLETGYEYTFTLRAGAVGIKACDILIGDQEFALASGLGGEETEQECTFRVRVAAVDGQVRLLAQTATASDAVLDTEEEIVLIDDVTAWDTDTKIRQYDPGNAEEGMLRIAFYPKYGDMGTGFLEQPDFTQYLIREGDVILVGDENAGSVATESNAIRSLPSDAVRATSSNARTKQ